MQVGLIWSKFALNAAVHHDFRSEIGHDDNACASCRRVFNRMSVCDGIADRNNNNVGFFFTAAATAAGGSSPARFLGFIDITMTSPPRS